MAATKKFVFKPEHAKVILELGKEGASQKAMYSAIGISKTTAEKLKKDDPDFYETMSLATTYGQAFWENMMLANIDNKAFNSRIAEIALRGQYPDDYRERMDIKQDIKTEAKIDFQGAVAELINKLKEKAEEE
jgi:DNA-binding XRE family transcriptional regulator